MRTTWLVGAVVCLAWLWLFRGPLFLGEVIALRDAGNFYYPLFAWQCEEWSAGRIPLWNPLDGLGAPALADGTSSVLYPGKLLFALPISFDLRFNLYIAGHVLLAAGSVYWVARRWGASAYGAGVGALSYAYGGYVLFQYCNPVFLISAAWLPLAVWLGDAMLVRRSRLFAVGLGAVLALMILGGDPQTACHAGILIAVDALLLWRSNQTSSANAVTTEGNSFWKRMCNSYPMLLVLAAAAALGFGAVQILPTWEWARQSDRAPFDVPRSVYEIPTAVRHRPEQGDDSSQEMTVLEAIRQGLIAPPPPLTHAAQTYYYSVAPWRLIELLWPNISGRVAPVHQRWISGVLSEGKVWTPSLYVGLVPFVAAIVAWCQASGPRERWLKWLVLLGVLGSFGWYGLGWVVHELRFILTRDPEATAWIGQPVGGLYWLLVTGLPGYAYFRYPAKWFVVAALGCSLLAARGTDQMLAGDGNSRRLAKWLCLITVAISLLLVAGRQLLLTWMHRQNAGELYGPLDAEGAWLGIFSGGLQIAIESALLWRVLLAENWRRRIQPAPWLLLLTAADLVLANQSLVATVPGRILHANSWTANQVHAKFSSESSQPPPRVLHAERVPATPTRWQEQGSPGRLAEVVTWEQDALCYRHHLRFGIDVLDAPTTVRSADWTKFLYSARRMSTNPRSAADFNWLGVELLVKDSEMVGSEDSLVWNQLVWPRVWLLASGSDVELEGAPDRELGVCRIVRYAPHQVEVAVTLSRPATLVLTDAFDPNWVASSLDLGSGAEPVPRDVTISRIRDLVRGVDLTAGDHLVVFQYRPGSFYWGAVITVLAILLGTGYGVLSTYTVRSPPYLVHRT